MPDRFSSINSSQSGKEPEARGFDPDYFKKIQQDIRLNPVATSKNDNVVESNNTKTSRIKPSAERSSVSPDKINTRVNSSSDSDYSNRGQENNPSTVEPKKELTRTEKAVDNAMSKVFGALGVNRNTPNAKIKSEVTKFVGINKFLRPVLILFSIKTLVALLIGIIIFMISGYAIANGFKPVGDGLSNTSQLGAVTPASCQQSVLATQIVKLQEDPRSVDVLGTNQDYGSLGSATNEEKQEAAVEYTKLVTDIALTLITDGYTVEGEGDDAVVLFESRYYNGLSDEAKSTINSLLFNGFKSDVNLDKINNFTGLSQPVEVPREIPTAEEKETIGLLDIASSLPGLDEITADTTLGEIFGGIESIQDQNGNNFDIPDDILSADVLNSSLSELKDPANLAELANLDPSLIEGYENLPTPIKNLIGEQLPKIDEFIIPAENIILPGPTYNTINTETAAFYPGQVEVTYSEGSLKIGDLTDIGNITSGDLASGLGGEIVIDTLTLPREQKSTVYESWPVNGNPENITTFQNNVRLKDASFVNRSDFQMDFGVGFSLFGVNLTSLINGIGSFLTQSDVDTTKAIKTSVGQNVFPESYYRIKNLKEEVLTIMDTYQDGVFDNDVLFNKLNEPQAIEEEFKKVAERFNSLEDQGNQNAAPEENQISIALKQAFGDQQIIPNYPGGITKNNQPEGIKVGSVIHVLEKDPFDDNSNTNVGDTVIITKINPIEYLKVETSSLDQRSNLVKKEGDILESGEYSINDMETIDDGSVVNLDENTESTLEQGDWWSISTDGITINNNGTIVETKQFDTVFYNGAEAQILQYEPIEREVINIDGQEINSVDDISTFLIGDSEEELKKLSEPALEKSTLKFSADSAGLDTILRTITDELYKQGGSGDRVVGALSLYGNISVTLDFPFGISGVTGEAKVINSVKRVDGGPSGGDMKELFDRVSMLVLSMQNNSDFEALLESEIPEDSPWRFGEKMGLEKSNLFAKEEMERWVQRCRSGAFDSVDDQFGGIFNNNLGSASCRKYDQLTEENESNKEYQEFLTKMSDNFGISDEDDYYKSLIALEAMNQMGKTRRISTNSIISTSPADITASEASIIAYIIAQAEDNTNGFTEYAEFIEENTTAKTVRGAIEKLVKEGDLKGAANDVILRAVTDAIGDTVTGLKDLATLNPLGFIEYLAGVAEIDIVGEQAAKLIYSEIDKAGSELVNNISIPGLNIDIGGMEIVYLLAAGQISDPNQAPSQITNPGAVLESVINGDKKALVADYRVDATNYRAYPPRGYADLSGVSNYHGFNKIIRNPNLDIVDKPNLLYEENSSSQFHSLNAFIITRGMLGYDGLSFTGYSLEDAMEAAKNSPEGGSQGFSRNVFLEEAKKSIKALRPANGGDWVVSAKNNEARFLQTYEEMFNKIYTGTLDVKDDDGNIETVEFQDQVRKMCGFVDGGIGPFNRVSVNNIIADRKESDGEAQVCASFGFAQVDWGPSAEPPLKADYTDKHKHVGLDLMMMQNGEKYRYLDGDFMAKSMVSGIVRYAKPAANGSDGYIVTVEADSVFSDGRKLFVTYFHLQNSLVAPNQNVSQGQDIGYIGYPGMDLSKIRQKGERGVLHLHAVVTEAGSQYPQRQNETRFANPVRYIKDVVPCSGDTGWDLNGRYGSDLIETLTPVTRNYGDGMYCPTLRPDKENAGPSNCLTDQTFSSQIGV